MLLIISSIFAGGIQAGDIECTALQGGTYTACNVDCYQGNTDCYYGSGAAAPGQICYCYTSSSKPETVKSITSAPNNMINNIECTALQGGTYAGCNANCDFDNPDCYYGSGAAAPGQICYCYTDKYLQTIKPTESIQSKVNDIECTPLEGGDYTACNAKCYKGNHDCYYGSKAARPGQHCYCYTDNSKPETVKSIKSTRNNIGTNIECTALEGGTYTGCNANCNFGNPDCYYGSGAASPGQICYCYTDKYLQKIKPTHPKVNDIECTPLEGGDYTSCNENCYKGNPDCYYGSKAASPGQHCYCYTDKFQSKPIESIKPSESKANDIECTPLEGGNHKDCNANCYEGNSDCYYGIGAASSDQICYCYTNTLRRNLITENVIKCSPLEGGDYTECNANCNLGNSDCYYGTGAAAPGQICYCYTESKVNDIECTALEGGDYTSCNANCYKGNSDCYYGTGAASSGEHCYCYTETLRRRLIMTDDGCVGMIIGGLMIISIIIALIIFYYKQKKDVYLLSNLDNQTNIV